ncbi:FAD-binding oxidoreductase [Streptacidiphilus sp. N1-10]|uniref:FAD-binding oxidoreductase n=1 Tax=Streptacidiphilus jeojiensis TaxID=3229225 RepID=A0ABV6XNI3_9ACTN
MENFLPVSSVLASLEGTFEGETVLPTDPGYDQARRVWNATVDRRPAVIAYCRSTADVAAVVRAARAADLPLSVRGGGHQVAGLSVCDQGVVVDLSRMRSIGFAEDGTSVRAGGGCLLADVDRTAAERGRIVPAGVVSHTGLGGLALGGGFGWTFRNFGLTCDNITGAEVVTADGSIVRAGESDGEDADLLWALRGGGGNFGVVTEFTLRTHAVSDVLFGQAAFLLEDLPVAVAHYVATMEAAPDALSAICITCLAPPMPGMPTELVGRPVVLVNAVWSGDLESGAGPMEQLLTRGPSVMSFRARMPYVAVQSMQDDLHPHGRSNYNKSRYLDRVDDTAIKALLEAGGRLPGPHAQIEVLRLGGAASRVPVDATAFAHRGAAYILNVVAAWTEPDQAATQIGWARDTNAALDCVGSDAGYINFLDTEPDRVRSVYPPRTYRRLQAIKRRLDPDRVFRGNVPIEPAP